MLYWFRGYEPSSPVPFEAMDNPRVQVLPAIPWVLVVDFDDLDRHPKCIDLLAEHKGA